MSSLLNANIGFALLCLKMFLKYWRVEVRFWVAIYIGVSFVAIQNWLLIPVRVVLVQPAVSMQPMSG